MPMSMQWKIETASEGSWELSNLLENGWEPFAVASGNVDFFYLRKEVPAPCSGFVEGPDLTPEEPCESKGGEARYACDLARGHTGPHMAHDAQATWSS